MFLLDTNVVSELRKIRSSKADRNVAAWEASAPSAELYVSAITILELELGVLLAERKDRTKGARLRAWLEKQVLPSFAERVLPVDHHVARRCASLHVPKTRPERDAFIAATALVHGLTVVTRDVSDFAPMGVAILNPWLI